MRRKYKDYWKRTRQRRRDARRRKYHKHHRPFSEKPRATLILPAPPKDEVPIQGLVNSPPSLSLLSEVKGCVKFFSNIRNQASVMRKKEKKSVTLNIANISKIDLPATMVLNALGRELGGYGINLKGNFPIDGESPLN